MIGYIKHGSENMSFMVKDNDLIEVYDAAWDKVSTLMRRGNR